MAATETEGVYTSRPILLGNNKQGSGISLDAAVPLADSNKFMATKAENAANGELATNPCPMKICESLTYSPGFWNPQQCAQIEAWIDDTCWRGAAGLLPGANTVDTTPCRTKYFFGNGYTYGRGLRGREALLPLGSVCPIPDWLQHLVIAPLESRGMIPPGWVDSVVMNDYRTGSSIVAHVDPPRLFARPILTASFFEPARLVFGASFDPERKTPPAYAQFLTRGSVLMMDGYSANKVTHGIRPEDMMGDRRVSMILRHLIVAPPESLTLYYPDASACANWLVSQIQGLWRDAVAPSTGSRSRFYLVRGLLVTILMSSQPASSAYKDPRAAKFAVEAGIWQLLPVGEGLVCNGGFLDEPHFSPRALEWQYLRPWKCNTEEDGSVPGFTWIHVGDDLSSI